jgi:hypothetical protein
MEERKCSPQKHQAHRPTERKIVQSSATWVPDSEPSRTAAKFPPPL